MHDRDYTLETNVMHEKHWVKINNYVFFKHKYLLDHKGSNFDW